MFGDINNSSVIITLLHSYQLRLSIVLKFCIMRAYGGINVKLCTPLALALDTGELVN
jgi:hypothetical protein